MSATECGRPAIIFVLLLAACTGTPASTPSEAEGFTPPRLAAALRRPDHVVLISVARLTSDRYDAFGGVAPDMPTLAKLAAAGVAADAVTTVAPASRYPAHASIVTGRTTAAHGISADLQLGKRGVRGARYWHASTLAVPSLWNLADRAELRVAALVWPSTVGAPASVDLMDFPSFIEGNATPDDEPKENHATLLPANSVLGPSPLRFVLVDRPGVSPRRGD